MRKRTKADQKNRFKDTLKAFPKDFNMSAESLHRTEQRDVTSLERALVNTRIRKSG